MTYRATIALLALACSVACGNLRATESARHNDMDGDRRSDLIWRNVSTGALVYWSGGNGTSRTLKIDARGEIYDPRASMPLFALSDYWAFPSRTMLVVSDQATGDRGLYPSSSQPDLYALGLFPYSSYEKAVGHGDFDGDGTADVFYRASDGRNHIVGTAAAADWGATYQAVPNVPISWEVSGIGDFDADGHSDVLWRNKVSGANAIWRSGNYLTQLPVRSVTNLDWKIVAIGDFDGDGRDDIFWRNARSGANTIWKSGNALTQQAVSTVSNLAWQVAATGDFDGDGKCDVMWRNGVTGGDTVWKSARATTQMTLRTVNLGWSVVK